MTNDLEQRLARVRTPYVRAIKKHDIAPGEEFILLCALLSELMTCLHDDDFESGMRHINHSVRLARDFFREKGPGENVQ